VKGWMITGRWFLDWWSVVLDLLGVLSDWSGSYCVRENHIFKHFHNSSMKKINIWIDIERFFSILSRKYGTRKWLIHIFWRHCVICYCGQKWTAGCGRVMKRPVYIFTRNYGSCRVDEPCEWHIGMSCIFNMARKLCCKLARESGKFM
jgi:hypothetical protein